MGRGEKTRLTPDFLPALRQNQSFLIAVVFFSNKAVSNAKYKKKVSDLDPGSLSFVKCVEIVK